MVFLHRSQQHRAEVAGGIMNFCAAR
jgi:hypothetical protein